MRKFFIFAAMAGAILVSCTKNEPAASKAEKEISFASPVVSHNTKAVTEVWNTYPMMDDKYNFSVWAHYYDSTYDNFENGTVYMDEVTLDYLSGNWRPSTPYYWPNAGSLTFIAYSPSSKAEYASVTANGIAFTNYVVSQTQSEQVDLLFSERAYDKRPSDENSPNYSNEAGSVNPFSDVNITFKHALSSILFTIHTKETYSNSFKTTLKKIELIGIKSVGTFNQGLKDENGAATDYEADLWTGETIPVTYTIEQEKVLNAGGYYTCNKSYDPPVVKSGKRDTDFILLPQVISDDAKLKVTYTIKGNDSEVINQEVEVNLKSAVAEWKCGYRYKYNISIGYDSISFEPYASPWTDAEPNAGNVNIN